MILVAPPPLTGTAPGPGHLDTGIMRLEPHPDAARGSVHHFDAGARRDPDGLLHLSWRLDAEVAGLRLPPPGPAGRGEGLWQHTCFEAFVAVPGSPGYVELNFAPSGQWSAWTFSDYRQGMAAASLAVPPRARWHRSARLLALEVAVPITGVLPAGKTPWCVGLAAVLEAESGTVSYWALRHGPGRPDFHRAENFLLLLADPALRPAGGDG